MPSCFQEGIGGDRFQEGGEEGHHTYPMLPLPEWFCMKMGISKGHFNALFIVRGKATQCP